MLPDAEPFSASGGPNGALIVHGFTGSPQSMKPLAYAFAEAGYAVELPLLPGHGTTAQDMAATSWSDWSSTIETAYDELAARCARVVVAGLSMGGSLTAWLGTRHPEIAALIAVNALIDPDAPIWAALIRAGQEAKEEFLPAVGSDIAKPGVAESAYDSVPVGPLLDLTAPLNALKADLGRITSPMLVFVSPQDHVVDPSSSRLLAEAANGPVELVELERSYHVATIDFDRDSINARSVAFANSRIG
jgi:carboxylesterase